VLRGSNDEILLTKGLARLGDSLINFIYSAALSLELGKPIGIRVKNEVLSKACKTLKLRERLKVKGEELSNGDLVESLLAFVWLKGILTSEDMIRIARKGLRSSPKGDENVLYSVVLLLKEVMRALLEI